jgi:GNAT superfamily N-acetyltransferase
LITYRTNLTGIDWEALRRDLIADDFHNGRTTDQLRRSFENSQHVAMAFDGERCIANGRLLSDGVGNAYVLDVWTLSSHRGRGVATRIMQLLLDAVPGQHVYLQTDDAVAFYEKLGFRPQPAGLSKIVGTYLVDDHCD